MVDVDELRTILYARPEWLLVREAGTSFAVTCDELDVEIVGDKTHFGFIDDKGFHSWRLNGFAAVEGEVSVELAGVFAVKKETIRLVPRTSAAELSADIYAARLEAANELAATLKAQFAGTKLVRVALNEENGRFAHIEYDNAEKEACVMLADVTMTVRPEAVTAAAMMLHTKVSARKKRPAKTVMIAAEKRTAAAIRRLIAMLRGGWREALCVVEIDRRSGEPVLKRLSNKRLSELWREKAPKLAVPDRNSSTRLAKDLASRSPANTDIVTAQNGETVRFNGMPFARVRSLAGSERAWFGTPRQDRPLHAETEPRLDELLAQLEQNRTASTDNRRHAFYRALPEAWLESLLRRNVSALDGNLVISPIYNQFRTSTGRIDLLALRRDGRLVIIEVKTKPDREAVLQAADYWRRIELQRRRGLLANADLFGRREIADKSAIVYLAAPAWSFHGEFEFFARALAPEIELWRFELHENWREEIKVIARRNYSGLEEGSTSL